MPKAEKGRPVGAFIEGPKVQTFLAQGNALGTLSHTGDLLVPAMLKRLELIGFKSFADKTRFDFATGITAIVGPNGSGKSNVVDAVKWVLGEQSAKSLRGGEMADVIFNGSSTRKSLGLAEVTMTFDNQHHQLQIDSEEVQITRRVYRDGQGEYLINGQICRLRDIKEMFLGSGAGHGAYSVIEQGRVDALLTASTKDRRMIFEEAAGISKFKAKKIEALRKLERVETDLLRVRDILQELDKQLRTLRLQGSKAQRYREYSERLQALRLELGRREFQEIAHALNEQTEVLSTLQTEVSTATQTAEDQERTLQQLDQDLARSETELRDQAQKLANAKEEITRSETTIQHERSQFQSLEAQWLQLGQQRQALGVRAMSLAARLHVIETELTAVQAKTEQEQTLVTEAEQQLESVTAQWQQRQKQNQHDREAQFEFVSRSARLQSDCAKHQQEAERLRREFQRKIQEGERTKHQQESLERVIADLSHTDADLRQKLQEAKQNHAEYLQYRDKIRQQIEQLQHELESQREARSSLRGRIEILENLERSWEGFGAGVREVFERMNPAESPLRRFILGLVADLITAPSEIAPWIDLALGDTAQRFVLAPDVEWGELAQHLEGLPGRVGFVPLLPCSLHAWEPPLFGNEEYPSLASYVRCQEPGLELLPKQLLGQVYLIPDMVTAQRQRRFYPEASFLTQQGEWLEADGSISIGSIQNSGGLFSRKSELRELRGQLAQHEARLHQLEMQQQAHRRQAESVEAPILALETEMQALNGAAGSLREQMRDQRLTQQQLQGMLEVIRQEGGQIEAEAIRAENTWQELTQQSQQAEHESVQLKERLAQADIEIAQLQQERERWQTETVARKARLERVREELQRQTHRRDENELQSQQTENDWQSILIRQNEFRQRSEECQLTILRCTATAAFAYGQKQLAEAQVRQLSQDREVWKADREQVQQFLKQHREAWNQQKDHAHSREMVVRDLRHRQETLVARLLEDYGIDLREVIANRDADVVPLSLIEDPAQAEQEIAELKQKIAKLGSVNLEALEELAELEKRETDLRTQHDDLTESQKRLQEIIDQINGDSRKLFSDTLATVRGHFQELFRKLFAGGMADIVLENEDDPLESGIEVTARPPGKELRSISLLSGGERTLTAIALLLAIFRSRPSPFCLLDEVDAALDEANTSRLVTALGEFLDRSQFIIITHKKRTMAAADVLYGVTMQESGVSKQVSVRFEDWVDEENAAA